MLLRSEPPARSVSRSRPRSIRAPGRCAPRPGASRDTRPTAVNLAWGVDRALAAFEAGGAEAALTEAREIAAMDVDRNRRIGAFGRELIPAGGRVYTHCNAGSLATVGYGTALGVVRAAAESGKHLRAWVGETRPLLQGARLTAWELDRLGIEGTIVVDGAAGSLMAQGLVDVVVVGADRIATNGDVVNKIGTYGLAVLRAPARTFPSSWPRRRRRSIPSRPRVPRSTIELRDPEEVTGVQGRQHGPAGVGAHNLAFDVTPARLVTAIVTERGHRPPRPTAGRSATHLRKAVSALDVAPGS